MVIHTNLMSYWNTSFVLTHDMRFTLGDIEEMYPFEFGVYTQMSVDRMEERIKQMQKQKR